MCNLLAQILGFRLSLLSPRNVIRYAAKENWFLRTVELDAAARTDPAHPTAREYYSIFGVITAVPLAAFSSTERNASRSSKWIRCKILPSSSRSVSVKPNNPRHLSVAQISFRARSRIQIPKSAPSTASLIRSSISRKPASLSRNLRASCGVLNCPSRSVPVGVVGNYPGTAYGEPILHGIGLSDGLRVEQ